MISPPTRGGSGQTPRCYGRRAVVFVRLKSTDPRDPPAIVQNLLPTQRDWEVLRAGLRMAEEVGAQAPTRVGCGASLLVLADQQQYNQPSGYQDGKENADNDRHNLMRAAGGRLGSGLLRRSDSRPEAKIAHRIHLVVFFIVIGLVLAP
jgi:GMC oxidoreductase